MTGVITKILLRELGAKRVLDAELSSSPQTRRPAFAHPFARPAQTAGIARHRHSPRHG
jgi:hypothetical protein